MVVLMAVVMAVLKAVWTDEEMVSRMESIKGIAKAAKKAG